LSLSSSRIACHMLTPVGALAVCVIALLIQVPQPLLWRGVRAGVTAKP
jgi:hypothetical protein